MDKTILKLIAIILGAFALLLGIGLLYSLLFYVLFLAIVCLGGLVAFRLLSRPRPEEIEAPDPQKELQKVQRLLDQYKKQDR